MNGLNGLNGMERTAQDARPPKGAQPSDETTVEGATLDARLRGALAQAGGGAWARELSLTLALAARARLRLDGETLLYSDVRDLLALQRELRLLADDRAEAGSPRARAAWRERAWARRRLRGLAVPVMRS